MATIADPAALDALSQRPKGNHAPGGVRTCDTTGLPVCTTAQTFVKLNAVLAIVFLLIGGIAALGLALTRSPAVHLLPVDWYYRALTAHGLNMLILWILFFEMAILAFVSTALLNTRTFSKGLAWAGFGQMAAGAVLINVTVWTGTSDVLMTSYAPLKGHPLFYLGIILVATGALTNIINYFGTLYIAKRDNTYEGSVPLVVFGATAAAIIAVLTLLHGATVYIPTFLWSIGIMDAPDAAWYRLIWWGLGHVSQQINVTAMVAVWYFLAHLTTGARPLNEAVCRTAFVLYILFINLASAHHLLVDPGVSAGWKIWNTSYAMYLAVLASMIHGFTVPAAVEVAQRARGYNSGMFGWLLNAPWRNPAFAAFFLSLVIFGFFGGITGVTLGTQQINIIAHNTMRIPGHFHTTVVGGTTLAFMALTYYVVPLIFRREYIGKALIRIQPWVFAAGILIMSVGMTFAGSMGVPRRHWDVHFSGSPIPVGFDASAHMWMSIAGVGGTIAFVGLLIYILLTVATVLFGTSNEGRAIDGWGGEPALEKVSFRPAAPESHEEEHRTPGTMVLVLLLLVSFAVYYFANWKALADVWHVR